MKLLSKILLLCHLRLGAAPGRDRGSRLGVGDLGLVGQEADDGLEALRAAGQDQDGGDEAEKVVEPADASREGFCFGG